MSMALHDIVEECQRLPGTVGGQELLEFVDFIKIWRFFCINSFFLYDI